MSELIQLLEAHDLVPPLAGAEAEPVAAQLAALSGLAVYPRSIAAKDRCVYFLGRRELEKFLCVLSKTEESDFEGTVVPTDYGLLKVCPTTHDNAAKLRIELPYTGPTVIGTQLSIGMGDRLGLATPGHIRAVRGSGMRPFLAQQSIREMTRTQRTPDQVMDTATWGVFEEGYRDGFGADADHLKTTEDIDRTLAAGFCMFTIDPGDHVDNGAGKEDAAALKRKLKALPWDALETTEADCRNMFLSKPFRVGVDMDLEFDDVTLMRAAVKYGKAVAHTVRLYRHLAEKSAGKPFELEMSVDETDSPTTPHEHFYVAHELKRLGVKLVSLAPRFIGDFEKGIDYKGDLQVFEKAFILHARIARHLGPYKISLHSGSDKFSIYPIAAKHAREYVHVKTAGTSYLEALRTLAKVEPSLFREILAFAFERYEQDKASYHVSADIASVAHPKNLSDDALAGVLEGNDGRQLLHVTFGSVLTWKNEDDSYRFRDKLLLALREKEEEHYEILARHMRRHVQPFVKTR